jgi:phosphoglycolate phosphatase-like HAD superfamily hydrolase
MSTARTWPNWRWNAEPREGPAVVFDLDGVLSDAAGRQHLLAWPRRDWDAFFDAVGEDPVIDEVAAVLAALDPGLHVVLLTARPLRVQRHTVGWLERNELRWDLLIMRDHGDYDYAREFKRRTVDELRAARLEPQLAFEDDRRNVEMFRGAGVPCVYIHSGYYD